MIAADPFFDQALDVSDRAGADAPAHGAGDRADLDEAHAEGYAAGLADGRHAARAEAAESADIRAAERDRTLASIVERLDALSAGLAARASEGERRLLTIVANLLERCAPALIERHGRDVALDVVRRAVAMAADSPTIAVSLPPADAEDLRARVLRAAAARGSAAVPSVLADPALEAGDVRVEWARARVEHSTAKLVRRVASRLVQACEHNTGDDNG